MPPRQQNLGKENQEIAPSSSIQKACLNCNGMDHMTSVCPTIRCERCGKLGHIRQICQVVLSWECNAALCGFQSPGLGFFYFPDSCSSKQVKERAASIVITVVEGNPTTRDIEQEFNEYLGTSWRCTARPINNTQYTMRFPNPKEVERACYFGKHMEMRVCHAVLSLSPWSASVGASGVLNKAWVRVRNVPSDKRCDANVAYAGSLVGVTLEVDQATLHRPEYCRILLGCRDIDKLPPDAEGVLGDHFYIFSYEVETVVVRGPPATRTVVHNNVNSTHPGAPSPKRARTDLITTAESSEGQTGASQNTSHGRGYSNTLSVASLTAVSEHESEEVEEESDEEEDYLINVITKQAQNLNEKTASENVIPLESNISMEKSTSVVQAPMTPVILKDLMVLENGLLYKRTYAAVLSQEEWPSLTVTEVEHNSGSPPVGSPGYFVQSPEESSGDKVAAPSAESGEYNLGVEDNSRTSVRNQHGKMDKVMEQAAFISKKRNLEGLYSSEDADRIKSGAEDLLKKAADLARRTNSSSMATTAVPVLMIEGL